MTLPQLRKSSIVQFGVAIVAIATTNILVYQWSYQKRSIALDEQFSIVSYTEKIASIERMLRDSARHISLVSDALISQPGEETIQSIREGFLTRNDFVMQLMANSEAHLPSSAQYDILRLYGTLYEQNNAWNEFLRLIGTNTESAMEWLILEVDPLMGLALNEAVPNARFALDTSYRDASVSYDKATKTTRLTIYVMIVASLGAIWTHLMRLFRMERMRDTIEHELIASRDVAESASLAKSRFLSNMSHELRTPMNGVIGMANLLNSNALPPHLTNYVDVLKTSADTALSLINEVLDFEAIEAGKVSSEMRVFSLQELTERLTTLLSDRANKKGLTFNITSGNQCPEKVIGDEGKVQQILINLIGNAIKFTDSGSVSLKVSSCLTDHDVHTVSFEVKDTGIGISKAQRSSIFESFNQADVSIQRRFGGTGLGLSISKSLAEIMGGSIEVSSQLGQGSTFSLNIPLKKDPNSVPVIETELPANKEVQSPKSILIVDENPLDIEIASHILELAGWTVCSTGSLEHAAQMTSDKSFDLILCDSTTRSRYGQNTNEFLASSFPDVPFLWMDGYGGLNNDHENLPNSNTKLQKPFSSAELLDAVKTVKSSNPSTRQDSIRSTISMA